MHPYWKESTFALSEIGLSEPPYYHTGTYYYRNEN